MSRLAAIETPGASGNRIAFAYRARLADQTAGRAGERRTALRRLAFVGAALFAGALVLA